MNDALEAISGKRISCSFCSESLLEAIGAMAEHSSYSELSEKFNSSDEFVDHCMEMLACKYIFREQHYQRNTILRCFVNANDCQGRSKQRDG
jgi:hypothetical protein